MDFNKQIMDLKFEHLAAQLAVPAAVNDQLGCELTKQLKSAQEVKLVHESCKNNCASLLDLEAQLSKLEVRTGSMEEAF